MDLLHQEHVLLVHGSGFSPIHGSGHFRIVALPPEDVLNEAFDRIDRFMRAAHEKFIRRLLGTTIPSPMERLIVTESGSIIDIFRSNSPIWLVRSETMSSIANEMSRKLGPDVLRTLRYAARDDWSMMLSESTITWKGMDQHTGMTSIDFESRWTPTCRNDNGL